MSNDQPATATPAWDDVPTRDDPPADGYYELTENGWGALIGWFGAGVGRLPADHVHPGQLAPRIRDTLQGIYASG
ncbi:hypothetical protein [Micromonospora echinospora]|uniref:hypothetical protein n=1 Tax=Micromonospora echinospora TaxID=1877 RepID=UPI00366B747E